MSDALSVTGNDRIAMGGNVPPDVMAFNIIDAYYDEAKNWASDGFKIENQAQADEVDTLDKALLKAGQEADALRIEEKRPLDEQIDAIQAKFNPYIQKGKGKVDIARSALKALLTDWRTQQERIKREAAEKARREAEEERRLAEEAMRKSSGDVEAREQAEQLLESAKAAEKIAKKADKAATTGLGLRTEWKVEVTDPRALAGHYWKTRSAEVDAFFLSLANADVRGGARSIPGCNILETRKAL